jgi:hypothetical protein
MLKRGHILLWTVVCFVSLPRARAADSLYGPKGISPEAVRQGTLGSCYFHAVVAALAQRREADIRKMIQSNSDGSFTVTFSDGKKETAYPEDLRYARESGYDLSDGQWVAVLFRAYAQRVLRQSLLQALDASDMFAMLKQPAEQLLSSSDQLVLAYDRAIRAQVDQYGNIDRGQLETRLKKEMTANNVPDAMQASVLSLLESSGFFDKMATMIQQNGELFGAYRAVGQGGLADRTMETLAGTTKSQENQSEAQTAVALATAVNGEMPIVACTGGSRYYQALENGRTLPPDTQTWYVNAHCYTVLNYDAASVSVNIRNPWARHPDPDGVFNLPLSRFYLAFAGIVTPQ